MATPEQILSTLSLLAGYYNREPTEAQARLYIQHLANLPAQAIDDAAHEWIARSPFFPKINELLTLARENIPTHDYLTGERHALERAFYTEDELNPQAWQDLAVRYQQAGREYGAAYTLEKLRRLQLIAVTS